MDRRVNVGYHLWGLLTLFLWLKRWNIEAAPAEESTLPVPVPALAAMS